MAGSDFVALGELLVDLLANQPGVSLSASEGFTRHLGGAPANVACNMARLGFRSAMVALVGADPMGDFLLGELARHGVETTWVGRHATLPTSLVFATRGLELPDFMPYRLADQELDVAHLPLLLLENARVVHTTASSIAREPGRSAILGALRRARRAGALVSFDPNYCNRGRGLRRGLRAGRLRQALHRGRGTSLRRQRSSGHRSPLP
jgi:fructokinase